MMRGDPRAGGSGDGAAEVPSPARNLLELMNTLCCELAFPVIPPLTLDPSAKLESIVVLIEPRDLASPLPLDEVFKVGEAFLPCCLVRVPRPAGQGLEATASLSG
jgi:hypothetical protein